MILPNYRMSNIKQVKEKRRKKTERSTDDVQKWIPYSLEQNQLNDQGNEQSSPSQLSYIYSPAPHTIHTAKGRENKTYWQYHRQAIRFKTN